MNWLKKGPELKMPKLRMPSLPGREASGSGGGGLKPPAFLADLYCDLRDRRLLLPIALVVVAIAAVPILLGGSDPLEPPPAAVDGDEGPATASASLAVVEAKPGLRDYRKRLGGRTATDPFKQRYTGVPPTARLEETGPGPIGGGGGSEAVTVEESSTTVEVDPGGSGGSGGAPSGGGEGGRGTPGKPRLYEFVVDVQISRTETTADGREKMGEPTVRHKVLPLTQLPGMKAPVVTTMGINLHNGKVMFLVSDEVKSLSGEFDCVSRTPDGLCELMEVETGFPVELVYGPNEVRYRIKPIKIDIVRAGEVGDERSSKAEAALEVRHGITFQNFSK